MSSDNFYSDRDCPEFVESDYQPKVLMYHRVVDDMTLAMSQKYCVHRSVFKKQLTLLDRMGFTTITLNDYLLAKSSNINLPKKPVIITFDDGYMDVYEYACPIIKELGMTATIFVIGDQSIRYNIWDCNNLSIERARLLEKSQIRNLHEIGFEIASHSLTHRDLTPLSHSDLFKEISHSKQILESLLGSRVNNFSYPYGRVDNRVKRYVREQSYKYACSVYSGPATFGKDPFEIRRTAILNNTSLPILATMLLTPSEYVYWLWWKIKQKIHPSDLPNYEPAELLPKIKHKRRYQSFKTTE